MGLSVETMRRAYVRGHEKTIVALVFQAVGEFGAALLGDATGHDHVHEVGLDVPQNARVVRDEQQTEAGVRLGTVNAFRDDLQRVHVEAGVGLVEHGELRLEQFQLEDLVALLLAARKAFVDVALREGLVHAQVGHGRAHILDPAADRGGFAFDSSLGRAQEIGHGHTGNLDRVLHGQEQTGTGALINRHGEHFGTVQQNGSAFDLVLGVTGDRVREGRLARTVRAHDRVDLALIDGEIDSPQNLLGALLRLDADVQVFDFKI